MLCRRPPSGPGRRSGQRSVLNHVHNLAWYIAHRPFGVVAGSIQYKHARIAVFEGYAGTSASGFTAEVHAEDALARLDLLEDLYQDWNRGGRSGRVNAEFERIRRDLGDLPGLVADHTRLHVPVRRKPEFGSVEDAVVAAVRQAIGEGEDDSPRTETYLIWRDAVGAGGLGDMCEACGVREVS